MNSEELSQVILELLDDNKAQDVIKLNLAGKTDIADYMIVASGTSSRHISHLADKLCQHFKQLGLGSIKPEGEADGNWMIVDANSTIIHLFLPEKRELYALEELWQHTTTR